MLVRAIAAALFLASGLVAQTSDPDKDLSDAANTIESLRQISKELSETVQRFNARLDEAASKFDRGYKTGGSTRVEGADSDLNSPAEIVGTAVRKAVAFRMVVAKSDGYRPEALGDLSEIERLISEANKLQSDGSAVLRRLLVVSSQDMTPRRNAEAKQRHGQLLKGIRAAEQAAANAYSFLPVEAPGSDDDGAAPDWAPFPNDPTPRRSMKTTASVSDVAAKMPLPLRIDHRKRVTLVNQHDCRVALTDSGVVDGNGRHLFYEEEWLQRGDVVIRRRWRVALDTATGQHILLKRYPPLELAGALRNVYERLDRDYLWYVEPAADAAEPSGMEAEEALSAVAGARKSIEAAANRYQAAIREMLAREDQRNIEANQGPLDAGLPAALRESLFAIREDLAKTVGMVNAESKVRRAVEAAQSSVSALEPVAAWANVAADDTRGRRAPVAEWDRFLERADREIDLLNSSADEAIGALPPDMSQPEARFPALANNMIVRIRRLPPANPRDETISIWQEIWRKEAATGNSGALKVRRTAVLINVDRKTGDQVVSRGRTTYYPAGPDDALESIFDEYAADDLLASDRT